MKHARRGREKERENGEAVKARRAQGGLLCYCVRRKKERGGGR
jgi:hypothetical protein